MRRLRRRLIATARGDTGGRGGQNRGRLLELEPAAGDRELDQVGTMQIQITTHRDNWSPLTMLERCGARLERGRYQDVEVDLEDPAVRAELLAASASKSIAVAEGARELLEAHGLTVTATGAVVELKMIAPRGVVAGEQLEEGALPPGATGERIAAPAPDDDEDDDEDDELDQVDDPDRPPHEDPPAAGRAGRGRRGGARKSRAGGRA